MTMELARSSPYYSDYCWAFHNEKGGEESASDGALHLTYLLALL